jgi:hypothetical protein
MKTCPFQESREEKYQQKQQKNDTPRFDSKVETKERHDNHQH